MSKSLNSFLYIYKFYSSIYNLSSPLSDLYRAAITHSSVVIANASAHNTRTFIFKIKFVLFFGNPMAAKKPHLFAKTSCLVAKPPSAVVIILTG